MTTRTGKATEETLRVAICAVYEALNSFRDCRPTAKAGERAALARHVARLITTHLAKENSELEAEKRHALRLAQACLSDDELQPIRTLPPSRPAPRIQQFAFSF